MQVLIFTLQGVAHNVAFRVFTPRSLRVNTDVSEGNALSNFGQMEKRSKLMLIIPGSMLLQCVGSQGTCCEKDRRKLQFISWLNNFCFLGCHVDC
jgi:hypothetical protein